MDLDDKDKYEVQKSIEDLMNNHSTSIASDCQFVDANIPNSSMGLILTGNPMVLCASRSSASMVDKYDTSLCDHHTKSLNLGFSDIDVQTHASPSCTTGIRKGAVASLGSVMDRTLNMGCNPPMSMLEGGIFLPNSRLIFQEALSQFPADSGFVERAARFSCFNGHNYGDMVSPSTVPDSVVHYHRAMGMINGAQDVFMATGFNSVSSGQSQKNGLHVGEATKHGTAEGITLKNQRSERLLRVHEEVKGAGGSGNESDEAELSGSVGGGQEDLSMLEAAGTEPSPNGVPLKKRKRIGQAKKTPDQSRQEIQPKTTGKHSKQGPQVSDLSKEEYIHVRARRGQATNSHSLAERVRREKISERMKFLQDLVPGCSKVTGKAVMLDEIINYVQSLQQQVEFLSMKLVTLNPQLDFDIEGLPSKDILPSRTGLSSTLGFSPDMPMAFPQMLAIQPGFVPAGHPGLGTSSDLLRRTINSQMILESVELKEVTQAPNVWEEELKNIAQMNFGTNATPEHQDVNGNGPVLMS